MALGPELVRAAARPLCGTRMERMLTAQLFERRPGVTMSPVSPHRMFSNRGDELQSYGSDKVDMCIGVAVGAREPLTP